MSESYSEHNLIIDPYWGSNSKNPITKPNDEDIEGGYPFKNEKEEEIGSFPSNPQNWHRQLQESKQNYILRKGGYSWNSENTYNKDDIVLGSNGKYYISLSDNNINNNPISFPQLWDLTLIEKKMDVLKEDIKSLNVKKSIFSCSLYESLPVGFPNYTNHTFKKINLIFDAKVVNMDSVQVLKRGVYDFSFNIPFFGGGEITFFCVINGEKKIPVKIENASYNYFGCARQKIKIVLQKNDIVSIQTNLNSGEFSSNLPGVFSLFLEKEFYDNP